MAKKPMFIPHPDGEQYLINLAGCVLMAGDTIFGPPEDTTPQGRINAMRLVERALQEAEKMGFKQSSTVWALMRRNNVNPRLTNLVQSAMDLVPSETQKKVMAEVMSAPNASSIELAIMGSTKNTVTREPEVNTSFTRPGPDGLDPRSLAAGNELERITREEGVDAAHKPEHAHLYTTMLRYAPKEMREMAEAKAHELGLIPKATHVDERGQPVYSIEQLAKTHGVSTQEVQEFITQAGISPADLYDGPAHPIQ